MKAMKSPITRKLTKKERERIYVYPDGSKVSIKGVVAVGVSSRGTHRLETDLGAKYIILPGFLYIILDVDEWSF